MLLGVFNIELDWDLIVTLNLDSARLNLKIGIMFSVIFCYYKICCEKLSLHKSYPSKCYLFSPVAFPLPPDMGVMLTLVTDITLEDIMWEEIIGGSVVESTVAELIDPREDGEDPRKVVEEIRGEDLCEVREDPREDPRPESIGVGD